MRKLLLDAYAGVFYGPVVVVVEWIWKGFSCNCNRTRIIWDYWRKTKWKNQFRIVLHLIFKKHFSRTHTFPIEFDEPKNVSVNKTVLFSLSFPNSFTVFVFYFCSMKRACVVQSNRSASRLNGIAMRHDPLTIYNKIS